MVFRSFEPGSEFNLLNTLKEIELDTLRIVNLKEKR